MKRLRDAVAAHPALTYLQDERETTGGRSRLDLFRYSSRFPELPGLRPVVLLEPGIQSGDHPTVEVDISSLAAEFLRSRGQGDIADDLTAFRMTLLHFRRTFVEKLFTIHSKVERLKAEGHPLGRDARHYADLYALAGTNEVLEMLRDDEYRAIKEDYDRTSGQFFPASHRPPPGLAFVESDALFPPAQLRKRLEPDYLRECALLFPGSHPSFDDVLERFLAIRDLL